jgi:hypothetical protein
VRDEVKITQLAPRRNNAVQAAESNANNLNLSYDRFFKQTEWSINNLKNNHSYFLNN